MTLPAAGSARRPYAKRHAFQALQEAAGGSETLLATFTVTAKRPPRYARQQVENRCRAADFAAPGLPTFVREINSPRTRVT